MSPMLTRGSQLVHRDPDAQATSPGAQHGQEQSASERPAAAPRKASSELPISVQPGAEATAAQKANSFEAGSFLSLSPTMQWLQVKQLCFCAYMSLFSYGVAFRALTSALRE